MADTATKAGARHSSADMQMIQDAHDAIVKAGAACAAPDGKAAKVAAIKGLLDLSATKQLPFGYAVAFEAWDVCEAANVLAQLAQLAAGEATEGDAAAVGDPYGAPVGDMAGAAQIISIMRLLVTFIGSEIDGMQNAPMKSASTPDTADTMIYAGDAVKALPNGHVGGYLVRFSTADDPDLSGEYFTKDTDFGIEDGAKTHVWFHHRGAFKARDGRTLRIIDPIGEGTLKIDDTGVFVDAILYNRAQYEAVLSDLGWSSGTASHLVDAEPKGKATWLKRWYLGLDATLTFGPCEPRNVAVPLKSLTAAEVPFTPDTKSADAPELDTETGRSPVVAKSALPELVTLYTIFNEDTIKSRLDRLRRH